MVKPLSFKGEKKPKKRKHAKLEDEADGNGSSAMTTATTTIADAQAAEEDETWVTAEAATDLTGPVVVVLPTVPATCLACDATGKVFPITIENMFEGDASTAEPHDVRQVWVANQMIGTDSVSLKGHHGRYLTADKYGILSATREAISPEEQFVFLASPDTPGTFSIQTQRDTFLASNSDSKVAEIRGDAEAISFDTTFRVRMQARFKPRLKAKKENKAREKVSRKELEEVVGRRLEDEEVRRLKKARREGNYYEAILDVRVSGKHDKFAS